ncbi:MAG TPA: DNA repair protein RecN [Ktedonobacterales bacterium]|jgi:DNA repair protein RecN (Recombination protein N)
MLTELLITDFAIIDRLELHLNPRFNVFTGETGAGKSIIIDAVSALLGSKLGIEVVRSGAERATVYGTFSVGNLPTVSVGNHQNGYEGSNGASSSEERDTRNTSDAATAGAGDDQQADARLVLAQILSEYGLEAENGEIILGRELHKSGRSTARINQRPVPLQVFQQVGSLLVDIHGQSEHLTILRPEQHVNYLDRYAEVLPLRNQVSALVGEWRTARRELTSLQQNERELERRIELLRFQVNEIEQAKLQPNEVEEMERERRVLNNAERLAELCAGIYGAIGGGEDGPSASDLTKGAKRSMDELVRLDPSMQEYNAALEEIIYRLEDVAMSVRSYQQSIEADPARLAEIEERLDLIAKLRRKYGSTIEEILHYAAESAAELDRYQHREERMAALQARDEELRAQIGRLAGQLSQARSRAAVQLSEAMERQLDDLNMKRARFKVDMRQQFSSDGAPAQLEPDGPTESYAFTGTGIDRVEFLIAPNPGEPFKPLGKIASGGETSRLMLALKSILSAADATPTLIFDEIDSGISGRSGQVVGEKLWNLTRDHQVLCVTHLPQIAAFGDMHLNVAKEVHGDRTMTRVRPLEYDQRTMELGQMLGGALTDTSRRNAEELLQRAEEFKQHQPESSQPTSAVPGSLW